MANTYHQIYFHLVFGVKYRRAILETPWRKQVFSVIGNVINESNCKTLIVNGVDDHVHCLAGIKPMVSASELMKATKARSSKYINDHNLTKRHFEWQSGYGVFSLKQSDVGGVYQYIKNQEVHHRKKTFIDEYRVMLKELAVAFDERYIFQELI